MRLLVTLCCLSFTVPAFAQVDFSSSNLPVIVINTNGQDIVDDPKIVADCGIINNGNGQRNNIADAFNEYSGKIGIEIRGQSSQMFPMKSYAIELRKKDGETSQDVALLGLPAHSDWVLYAPYTDKTLMRNFLAYTMSREMGRWAANCRYVEVILNGQYNGIYVLEEQIKRDKNRVNISKLKPGDITGDNVTGGYIVRLDKDYSGWYSKYETSTKAKVLLAYYYPKEVDIVQQQKDYIAGYVDSFETALKTKPFSDTLTGYRNYADMGSFIDYFIVNEVSRNVDGYRLSSYFYKDKYSKGGKLNAGPVWDYDLAFRNAEYCDGSTTSGWGYKFNDVCGSDTWQIPFWWDSFMNDTTFTGALRCRWKELRASSLSEARINFLIDSINDVTAEARERHFTQWAVLGQYVWPNPYPIPDTYDGEISTLKAWIRDRLTWVDNNLPNSGPCFDHHYDYTGDTSFIVRTSPNPFYSSASVRLEADHPQNITMQVVNVAGKIMCSKKFIVAAGVTSFTVPAANWASGMYFFNFYNDPGERYLIKMVKQPAH